MTRLRSFAFAIGPALTPLPAVHAATFFLDGSTGADYDAAGDGWFTTPPNQPPDGVGGMGGQALGVACRCRRAYRNFRQIPLRIRRYEPAPTMWPGAC